MHSSTRSAEPFCAHPYASFLPQVERPARYVGGEWGQTRKPWESVSCRVCLAFPDVYDIGMSHLGTRILYHGLNQAPDILCERAFVPWVDLEEQLRKRSLPLVSLENARPLCDFDVVGISLQHELVFTNVLTLLDLGRIPLRASDRSESDPLVLAGGSVATHPEPIAPFFDAMVIGDGEEKALEVARRWAEDKRAGLSREARLRRLAELGGVYVPSLYSCTLDEASGRLVVDQALVPEAPLPVVRTVLHSLENHPFPEVFPTGGPEAVFERLSLEIARGCTQGCRFCQAGMIFRPERERDPGQLIGTIEASIAQSGQDEISLTSLSTADYSCIGPLVHELAERLKTDTVSMGVSSLRAYGVDESTLKDIRRVRAGGLTFAPEAGSQRMRDVINKNITEEQLGATMERVARLGWDRVKLYFMIGLPTETIDDVKAIVETTEGARIASRRAKSKGRPPQVTASVSTFVPKPHTPFQWAPMDVLEAVRQKHRVLRDYSQVKRVELKTHESLGSILEGILSRGDRRLADVIEHAWRGGARFDAWDGHVQWDKWEAALAEFGLSVEPYLKEFPLECRLPWSHIDVGIKGDFLLKEWQKALKAQVAPPCGRPAPSKAEEASADPVAAKLVCYHCGAECDLDEIKQNRQNGLVQIRSLTESRAAAPQPTEPRAPIVPQRWRLRFEKLERAAMLGHLDLVREMPRIFRRAGISLWYSQGFHPKPQMTFGPALSLGVPSFDEYVDIKTSRPLDPKGILDKLNGGCPDGIRFLAILPLGSKDEAIVNTVNRGRLLLGLDKTQVDELGGEDWLEKRIECVLAAERIEVEREGKNGPRTLDIRPYIGHLVLGNDRDKQRFAEGGIGGQWHVLHLELVMTATGSARLDEVIGALTDNHSIDYRAVRLALRSEDGRDPMEMAL